MIDEVHMLTSHAFNAMLKTLEEPPEHVKFILATTDPQKIPVTVLSRCLQFNLKQMPPGHIVSHLENILAEENITFDTPALRLLAQGAQGSMRDALSLTDQAIAYSAGKVTLEAVQGMLGALDHTYLVRLMDALAAQDGAALLAVADDMAARSLSWSAALQDLGTLLNRIAIAQAVPAALPDDLPELEDIQRLAAQFSAEDIQLFYQIVVHGRQELGLAPDEYAGFTMTLLRMLAFTPLHSSGDHKTQSTPASAKPVAALAKTSTAAKASIPAAATVVASKINESSDPAAKAPNPAMAALAAARSGKSSKPTGELDADDSAPPFPVTSASTASSTTPSTAPSTAPSQKKTELNSAPAQVIVNDAVEQSAAPINLPTSSSTTAATAATAKSRIDWPVVVRKLELRGVAQQLATQSELLSVHEDDVVIKIELRIPVDTLLSAGSVEKLATALTGYLNKKVSITTEIGVVRQTAHAASLAEQAERLQQAEQTLESDPFVQTLKREFGATIVPGSVRPI
jgi:DNA polymerase-3 subunit gamma/tau